MVDERETLDQITARLSEGPFKVKRDVVLPDGSTADITASRTYFSWKGLVILSQHVVVRHLDNARVQDMQELFEAGFQFGKRANRVPLLRGMGFGYMILPVIVGNSPDEALVQHVSACPRKHWSLFEYPVLIDLDGGRTCHYQGTAMWGAFFFSDMRRVVKRYVSSPAQGQA